MSSTADLRWTRRSLGLALGLALLVLLGGVVLVDQLSSQDAGVTVEPVYREGRVVASDNFERLVDAGWDEADVGGRYTVTEPADFEVANGTGVVTLPKPGTTRVAVLNGVRTADSTTTLDVLAPGTVRKGSGVYVGLRLRTTGPNYYRAVLRFAADQKVYVSIGRFEEGDKEPLVLAPETIAATRVKQGQRLTLTVTARGATPVQLIASVRTGSSDPVMVRGVDTSASRLVAGGPLALWTYVGGNSDAGKVVGVDNLNVRQLQLVTATAGNGSGSEGAGSIGGVRPGAALGAGGGAGDDPPGAEGAVPAGRGSAPLGGTSYPVPAGAVFVSSQGTPEGTGSQDRPYRSIQRAVDRAPTGATIVIRAGSYHETVLLPPSKVLTLQPYPGERVWLDGSSVVDGWRQVGSVWETSWNYDFDASPTYRKNAEDLSEPGWRFVNQNFPMAAHPDQVWVDGRSQTQVGSRSQVSSGTFYVDRERDRLVLGTDPTSTEVRASTLAKGLTVVGRGDVVRGIGVRRYATSVWQLGAATVNSSRVTLENMVFADNATTGVSVFAGDVTLSNLTSVRNGLMGLHANQADRLLVRNVWAGQNNLEHFNRAPSAGGMKLTSSRQVRVVDSEFADNDGHGLWFDASSYDVEIVGSRAERNTGAGMVVEISSRVRVVDNVLVDNGTNGLWLIDTDRVEVAGNTSARNQGANLRVVTDGRDPARPGLGGLDSRRPDDPAMSWVSRDLDVYDNVLAGDTGCVICVDDRTGRTAEDLSLRFDHNYYQPAVGADSPVFASWPTGRDAPGSYADFAAFRAATGQDRMSELAPGTDQTVDASGGLSEGVRAATPRTATALSAGAARAAGLAPGTVQLGASHP